MFDIWLQYNFKGFLGFMRTDHQGDTVAKPCDFQHQETHSHFLHTWKPEHKGTNLLVVPHLCQHTSWGKKKKPFLSRAPDRHFNICSKIACALIECAP